MDGAGSGIAPHFLIGIRWNRYPGGRNNFRSIQGHTGKRCPQFRHVSTWQLLRFASKFEHISFNFLNLPFTISSLAVPLLQTVNTPLESSWTYVTSGVRPTRPRTASITCAISSNMPGIRKVLNPSQKSISDEMWDLITKCWAHNPREGPDTIESWIRVLHLQEGFSGYESEEPRNT